MNVIFNNNNSNRPIVNKSQSKEKNKNYIAVFSNLKTSQNRYLSEKQRNLTKFNSQKKMKKNDNKMKNHKESINSGILVSFNDNNSNNIKIKNYTNLLSNPSKGARHKNTSQSLSKPKLEIEINNINSSNNLGTNMTRFSNSKKYKKNISEHDLVNNILNTFTNYNNSKGINIKLNFSSKKKINNDNNNNKIHKKCDTVTDNNKRQKQDKSNINKMRERTRRSSETKLFRSSSGFSSSNNHLAQTNSFFNNIHHQNQIGHISTCTNYPDWTNSNFGNIVKLSTQKNNRNNNKSKNKNNNKGPIIGKIIKNYKNNDLNCIFNMNLIPPVTPLNNIQDYFKNLYKIEYNSENKVKKTNRKNKKENDNNNEYREKEEKGRERERERERDTRTKNNDDYSQSKNTMTKTNDISKIKKEKDSIDNQKYSGDSPEEIHFYVITSIQNGKNMEFNLIRK